MDEVYSGMSLNDLKEMMKNEVKNVSLNDLYNLSYYFDSEREYLPEEYKEVFVKSVQNVIIERFHLLKNDTHKYIGKLGTEDVILINELLLEEEDEVIKHIMNITVVYASYFLKVPIHTVNTKFPGPVSVYKKGKYYYCPVKKYHIMNNESLCKYCVAKIIEE